MNFFRPKPSACTSLLCWTSLAFHQKRNEHKRNSNKLLWTAVFFRVTSARTTDIIIVLSKMSELYFCAMCIVILSHTATVMVRCGQILCHRNILHVRRTSRLVNYVRAFTVFTWFFIILRIIHWKFLCISFANYFSWWLLMFDENDFSRAAFLFPKERAREIERAARVWF